MTEPVNVADQARLTSWSVPSASTLSPIQSCCNASTCSARTAWSQWSFEISTSCHCAAQTAVAPPSFQKTVLQPTFHIHHLFEIRDALQKVKQGQEGQKTWCKKCKRREVNGFCRDCGKFVCEACIHRSAQDLGGILHPQLK